MISSSSNYLRIPYMLSSLILLVLVLHHFQRILILLFRFRFLSWDRLWFVKLLQLLYFHFHLFFRLNLTVCLILTFTCHFDLKAKFLPMSFYLWFQWIFLQRNKLCRTQTETTTTKQTDKWSLKLNWIRWYDQVNVQTLEILRVLGKLYDFFYI